MYIATTRIRIGNFDCSAGAELKDLDVIRVAVRYGACERSERDSPPKGPDDTTPESGGDPGKGKEPGKATETKDSRSGGSG